MKTVIVTGFVALVVCGFAGRIFWQQHAQRQAALEATKAKLNAYQAQRQALLSAVARRPEVPLPSEATLSEAATNVQISQTSQPAQPESFTNRSSSAPSGKPTAGPGKPPARDEWARIALSFVGADVEAEQYWVLAINDPSLSAHERQDLIEDLNEDGLSNPKHPGPEDLPLIVNRLAIIEELAGSPLDQVNAEAFQEAYKDLLNLAALAMGTGQPVK